MLYFVLFGSKEGSSLVLCVSVHTFGCDVVSFLGLVHLRVCGGGLICCAGDGFLGGVFGGWARWCGIEAGFVLFVQVGLLSVSNFWVVAVNVCGLFRGGLLYIIMT